MTTLSLNLTSALQSTLQQSGVFAYAVYFDASGSPTFTTLVDNGVLNDAGSYSIGLPSMAGGKIYFLIQSQSSAAPNDLTTLIQTESDISWQNSGAWDFRYDSFEYSLLSQTGDAGNLTSVEDFGLPMEVSIAYKNGAGTVQSTETRGYYLPGADATTSLFTELSNINSSILYNYSDGPLAGKTRMAIGPATAVVPGSGSPLFQPIAWDNYINEFKVEKTGIFISGFFNGAPDGNSVYHNAGYYSYELTWDANHHNLDGSTGTFWLSPTNSTLSPTDGGSAFSSISGYSQIQGYIQITPAQLSNSIYSTLGDVYIYTDPNAAQPYDIALTPGAMNTGANNQWGEVLTQFLTGFSAGYFGMQGASLNSQASNIDLSNSSNWDPTYAFGKHLVAGDVPTHVDPYSEFFFFNSNSYGSNYSDNLMSAYSDGGPLIGLYNPYTGANVDEISITIFDDNEVPTGYVTPTIYNYIDPGVDGFADAVASTNGLNIGMNFTNQMVILDETKAVVTLQFQTAAGWQSLDLSAAANTSGGNPGSLWDDWTIVQDAATQVFSISAGGNKQAAGSLVITNLPAAVDGVGWYKIVVHDQSDPTGTAANAKTFNLYATTQNSLFVNPAIAGQEGSLAVDGLAITAPQTSTNATITTFNVDFLYSAVSTLDPTLLTLTLDDPLSTFAYVYGVGVLPTAPVVGDMSGLVFQAGAGQTSTTNPTSTLTSSELAFGWTGYNPLAWTKNAQKETIGSSWINQYSNKVGALNVAVVEFAGTYHAPLQAIADIDGQWLTGTKNFGNGSYTATATEYDQTVQNALSPQSRILSFTVDVPELDLGKASSGSALVLNGSDDGSVPGNWIRFEASAEMSRLAADATLILYATDAAGQLVARDGRVGEGVTLADATLGKIGAVFTDQGELLLDGAQQVYLSAGQQLHFAVNSGAGSVDMSPNTRIAVGADGSATIDIKGFGLSAITNNVLSDSAELAASQNESGQPLMYLTQGAQLDVDISGSSFNTNTLGFIRFDVDSAGNLSVDGQAYGDTAAFHQAVSDNLDQGLIVSRGGRTSLDEVWTVQGEDGFYAPVLITAYGEVLVIGAANQGGHEYIRMYGENSFGFEDLTAARGSDFDFNDMVMRLTPISALT